MVKVSWLLFGIRAVSLVWHGETVAQGTLRVHHSGVHKHAVKPDQYSANRSG